MVLCLPMCSQMENTNRHLFERVRDLEFFDVSSSWDQIEEGFGPGTSDSREEYEKNLKSQPANWYWRDRTIKYTVNSLGYRAPEFNKVNWKESVVLFGCSNIFGIGVDDTDTISYHLEQMMGRPVINMGIGAGSITLALHNSVILKNICPDPYAVVHAWTSFDRTVYYNRFPRHIGPWMPANAVGAKHLYQWTEHKDHSRVHALMASMTSRHLWSNTRYMEATFFDNTAKLLNCETFVVVDHARDLFHPGPISNKAIARRIHKNLTESKN